MRALLLVGLLATGLLATPAPAPAAASDAPRLQLRGDLRLPAGSGTGVARVGSGWVVSGPDSLQRLDESITKVRAVAPAIPSEWRAKGYSRLGDVDVADGFAYVTMAQDDTTRNRQAVARFDAGSLRFVDAVELPQPEIAFVGIDPRSHVAYSMGHATGTALLRYDTADGWRPLPTLGLGRTLDDVRGADVASGALWLSTDDDRHAVYRIDTRTGAVTDLGSAGHLGGEVGGIDATPVGGSSVHVAVTDGSTASLTGFAVVGGQSPQPTGEGRSGWPPVLVMGAIALVVLGGGAGAVLVYRAWVGLRPRPRASDVRR